MIDRERGRAMDLQRSVTTVLFKAVLTNQYGLLCKNLLILAKSNKDEESERRINEIKEGCMLPFDSFAGLYSKSFYMPSNRRIRFMATGDEFSWSDFRLLAEQQFVNPLTDLMIEMLGNLGMSSEMSLRGIIEATNSQLNESQPRNFKVIFDNEEDIQAQEQEKEEEPDAKVDEAKVDEQRTD